MTPKQEPVPPTADAAPRRTGRRVGSSDTRAAIADAARELFARDGFQRTTIRAVATRAGVDPALVMYFFTTKRLLFAEVLALPEGGPIGLADIGTGDATSLADRLLDSLLDALDDVEVRRRLEALVRAAVSDPSASEVLRSLLGERLHAPIAAALGGPDAALRTNLIASAFVGLVVSRYLVAVEPLASAPPEELRRLLRPVFRRYLSEDG